MTTRIEQAPFEQYQKMTQMHQLKHVFKRCWLSKSRVVVELVNIEGRFKILRLFNPQIKGEQWWFLRENESKPLIKAESFTQMCSQIRTFHLLTANQ